MDGAGDHEGSGPGRLPEHLSSHHIRNGTWRDPSDVVNHNPNSRDTSSLFRVTVWILKQLSTDVQHISLYVWSHPNNTSANGAPCCNQCVCVCVNNHWRVGLTGSDGVSYDVDDDTGDADVGHPRDAPLSTQTNSGCYY